MDLPEFRVLPKRPKARSGAPKISAPLGAFVRRERTASSRLGTPIRPRDAPVWVPRRSASPPGAGGAKKRGFVLTGVP